MTTASGEEVPFTRGFEHEPEVAEPQRPVAREYTFSVVRSLFRMDGMAHRVLKTLGLVQSRALSLAEGPLRDPESEYERGYARGARNGGYHEAPKPENNLKAVIIGCTCTLLSAFVLGAWKLSNDSAAIRAELTEWKASMNEWKAETGRRMERLENRRP